MWRQWTRFVVIVAACLVSATAAAGPVEQLEALSINAANPSHMVVPYRYGGGGMFVSQDGGKSFGWLCSAGIAPSAVNRNARPFAAGDGQIYIGLFDGLLKGTGQGCGFAFVPELEKKYIADVTSDPLDPKRTYVITTNAMAENGIYMNDGSGTFAPFGSTLMAFLDRLFVVKNGEARRFYETVVRTNVETNVATYSVRVSDDDAQTWTDDIYDMAQFGPMDQYAEFVIVAINPTNPDHVVGRVWRKQGIDTLVYSTEKGKAGTWKLLAEPKEAEAITYTPEGVLYFGDSDQSSKSLFVVDKTGDAPRKLSDTWRPLCLGYDPGNKRVLACSNFYLFGEVDIASGELKPLLDLRCAENFVECPGQMPMDAVCEPQAQADFCHLSHWVLAPLCDIYDRGPELATYQEAQTIMCADGFGVPKVEGGMTAASAAGASAVGAAGACSAAATGGMCAAASGVTAGAAAPAVTAAAAAPAPTPSAPKSTGGGCNAVDGSANHMSMLLGAFLIILRRARARRTRNN